MLVRDLTTMIHQNAVEHGWWESKRSIYEIVALIHSEWSEALEEARAGRPLKYYNCTEDGNAVAPCDVKDETECFHFGNPDCPYRGTKPEGVAVELIDGCIRILDAFGEYGIELESPNTGEPSSIENLWGGNGVEDEDVPEDVGTLVAYLHAHTSNVILDEEHDPLSLVTALSTALSWVHRQGVDPLKLMLEKHEFNKSRPYKHGKNF